MVGFLICRMGKYNSQMLKVDRWTMVVVQRERMFSCDSFSSQTGALTSNSG